MRLENTSGMPLVAGVAQVVSTWGTRIRSILHHSIGKICPGSFKRGASNAPTDYDEQIRVPHVRENMGHPTGFQVIGDTRQSNT